MCRLKYERLWKDNFIFFTYSQNWLTPSISPSFHNIARYCQILLLTFSSNRASPSPFSFSNFDCKLFMIFIPRWLLLLHRHKSFYLILLGKFAFSSLGDRLCFGLHVCSIEGWHILLRSNWIASVTNFLVACVV